MELWGGSDPQHMIETIAAGEIGGRRMDDTPACSLSAGATPQASWPARAM